MPSTLVIILLIVLAVIYIPAIINFLVKFLKYKFIGNTYIYAIIAYLVCLAFALSANFNPLPITTTSIQIIDGVEHTVVSTATASVNPFVAIASSLFDALKMLVVAFDRTQISHYYVEGGYNALFSIGYVLASILGLIFTSLSVVLFFFKSFEAKIKTAFKRLSKKNSIYYIFSDSRNESASTIASNLKKQGHIVIMYVSRASLKTQEGNEYRDSLINKKLDVRAENFTVGIAKIIASHFAKKRKVFVYGLFSLDETSIDLANYFQEAILSSKRFKKVLSKDQLTQKDVDDLNNFKVFLNYHDVDFDLTHNYSQKSLHIINSVSDEDIISTIFIINNQIINFVDIAKLTNKDNPYFNVSFVGFDKINRSIYEKMTYSYQLFGDDINKVNYHILDQDSDKFATNLNNEFTSKEVKQGLLKTPYLYSVDSYLADKDITEFETIDKHIQAVSKDKNRFNKEGFELFIISINNDNQNINVASFLRKALLKNLSLDRLTKTYIYVKVSSNSIIKNYLSGNESYIISQKEFDATSNKELIPIVVFGENTLLSEYINSHYNALNQLGVASQKAYYGLSTLETEKIWFNSPKLEVNTNLASIYSLRTKLALLGYKLDEHFNLKDKDDNEVDLNKYLEDIKNKFASSGFPTKYDLDNPVIRLSSLEHNRWVAATYQIYKYTLLDFESFKKNNLVDGKLTKKPGWTKENDVRHICMLTNESLMKLREFIIKENKELEEVANKLTFYTDISSLKDVLENLIELKR